VNRQVTQRPRARLDLLEQFVYLGERASVDVAERYLAAVEKTCAMLAAQPLSGVPYDTGQERLTGLRRAPVKGFENYSLFYLPAEGSVDVIRVLHAARDIEAIFSKE
jgi:toxin ParE1/3/4